MENKKEPAGVVVIGNTRFALSTGTQMMTLAPQISDLVPRLAVALLRFGSTAYFYRFGDFITITNNI